MRSAAALLLVAVLTPACGGSPTSPTSHKTAGVTVVSVTSSADWSAESGTDVIHGVIAHTTASDRAPAGLFRYAVTVAFKETAGIGATINAVDLTWFTAAGPSGTTHFDTPLLDAYRNHLSPHGTAYTKTLAVTDDAAHEPYTSVEVKAVFVDDQQQSGVANGAGDLAKVTIPPPVITSFTADSPILVGASTTLQWAVSNATSVTIDQGIGPVPITTSRLAVIPTATLQAPTVKDPSLVYTLTATNPTGSVSATSKVTIVPDVEYRFIPAIKYPFIVEAVWFTGVTGGEGCDDHGHGCPLPDHYRFWGARPGQRLSVYLWIWEAQYCVTVQILKRGAVYLEADSCQDAGHVTLNGTF